MELMSFLYSVWKMHDSSKIPRRMAQSEERSWDDLSSEVNCEDISSQGNSATMLMVKR